MEIIFLKLNSTGSQQTEGPSWHLAAPAWGEELEKVESEQVYVAMAPDQALGENLNCSSHTTLPFR